MSLIQKAKGRSQHIMVKSGPIFFVPDLEDILNSLPLGITIQSIDGKVVYSNKRGLEMTKSPSLKALHKRIDNGLIGKLEMYDEHGNRLGQQDIPGRRTLQTGKEQASLIRYTYGPASPAKWSLVKAVPLRDSRKEMVGVINSFIDLTELKTSQESLKILNKMVKSIARSVGYHERFQRLAEMVVPEFADWCIIDLIDKKGGLLRVALASSGDLYTDPDKDFFSPKQIRSVENYVHKAISQRTMLSYSNPRLNISSAIITPLKAKRKVRGAISFVFSSSGRVFSDSDINFLKNLTMHASILAENAKIFVRTQERLIREKHIKRELQQSHETLRVALEAGKMGLWELDVKTMQVRWTNDGSPADTSQLKKLTLKQVMKTIHPEDRDNVMAGIRDAIETSGHLRCEFRTYSKDKKVRWIRIHGSIVGDYREKLDRMIGIHVDITHEKKAQTKLQENESKFRAIVEASFDAILLYDNNGAILDANRSAIKLFGMSRMSLISSQIDTLLGSLPDRRSGELTLRPSINGVMNLEYTLTKSFMPDANVIFLHDITDRVTDQKRREHFLDIAGHEIKTPLSSIKAYVHILKKTANGESREFLSKIDSKTNIVTSLINELLDVTRIRQNQMKFVYEVCNIHEIMEDIRNDFALTSPTHKIMIKGSVKKDLICDKNRIVQVVNNLIKNAIRYSPAQNKVWVELKEEKSKLYIKVADKGIGIRPENLGKVFDIYFRTDKSQDIAPGGLGVGLFISSEIVKAHGGSISVASKHGHGATFTVTLPLKPKREKHAKKNSPRRG
jgi:PAS domain S-box-containing protein